MVKIQNSTQMVKGESKIINLIMEGKRNYGQNLESRQGIGYNKGGYGGQKESQLVQCDYGGQNETGRKRVIITGNYGQK